MNLHIKLKHNGGTKKERETVIETIDPGVSKDIMNLEIGNFCLVQEFRVVISMLQ